MKQEKPLHRPWHRTFSTSNRGAFQEVLVRSSPCPPLLLTILWVSQGTAARRDYNSHLPLRSQKTPALGCETLCPASAHFETHTFCLRNCRAETFLSTLSPSHRMPSSSWMSCISQEHRLIMENLCPDCVVICNTSFSLSSLTLW